jgi:DNA-binding transcriptional LysR family regulator
VFCALPASGAGMRVRALAPMEMHFVGHAELDTKRRYTLAQMARRELMTFQRGSQPHVAVLELFRRAGGEMPRVHAISSISAMAELVKEGFGIAVLPRAAAERLAAYLPLRVLACDTALTPLPIHASLREDPTSPFAHSVLDSALAYVAGKTSSRRKNGSSEKSMS